MIDIHHLFEIDPNIKTWYKILAPYNIKSNQLAEWLDENTGSKYYHDELGMLNGSKQVWFESEEDLTLFKLTWL